MGYHYFVKALSWTTVSLVWLHIAISLNFYFAFIVYDLPRLSCKNMRDLWDWNCARGAGSLVYHLVSNASNLHKGRLIQEAVFVFKEMSRTHRTKRAFLPLFSQKQGSCKSGQRERDLAKVWPTRISVLVQRPYQVLSKHGKVSKEAFSSTFGSQRHSHRSDACGVREIPGVLLITPSDVSLK